MAIPVLTPRLGALALPSDIMGRIAQAAQAQTQANVAAQTALPLAQALLRSRQQQLQQSQQAFPLLQHQRQQQAQLTGAQAQAIPIKNAILEAQLHLASVKAQQPKLTPTEVAFNAWQQSFQQDPSSPRTAVLGIGLKNALSKSKGASITTPGGTTVTLGGTQAPGAGTTFFPQGGQTVGGAVPQAPAAAPQLTPQQSALQALLGGGAPGSPLAQVGGIGGSRRTQGITLVDPKTGQVTTTPTRQVTTLNQNAVESAQKLAPIITKISDGFAPFASIPGEGEKFLDKILSGFGVDPKASAKIEKLNESQDEAKIAATDLMRAVGAPATVETEKTFEQIFKPRFGENPTIFKQRMIEGIKDTVAQFAGTASAAQLRGILLGTLKPGTQQFKAAVREGSLGIEPSGAVGAPSAPSAQTPSQEDLEFTAQQKGLTVQQVKQRLGIK